MKRRSEGRSRPRAAAGLPSRRNRHDRRYRGPLAWPATPSMKSRSDEFDEAVLAAVEAAERDWEISVRHIEIAVEDVPPSDPSAWEDSVCLGRAFPAQGALKARIVVYRLPISTRTSDGPERAALVDHVVRSQLSALTGHPYDEDL